MSDEKVQSDHNVNDGFAIPNIPFEFKKPIANVISVNKQTIDSSANQSNLCEQQESVKKIPPLLTELQPNKDIFFFDVIKDGVIVTRHYLNKNCVTMGRAVDCDLVFEHFSISRYHAALYWKENSQNLDDNGFFYLTDLNSSHGTFHNKTQVEQNKFVKLEPNKSFIKLGASSRLLLYSIISNQDDDYDSDTQSPLCSDIISADQQQSNSENLGCTWGIDLDYDSNRKNLYSLPNSGLQTVLNIINENTVIDKTENESVYNTNPQNVIQKWFDYEGYEYEYTIINEHNKFRCKIEFPIEDQYVPISGEDEIKKKDAINSACLRACRILDKAFLLFPWQKNKRFSKHKGSDSEEDEDELIDETGERESKKMRLEALKNRKVENLDTLKKRSNELKMSIETLKNELDQVDQEISLLKTGNKKKNDDELDQFMKAMSTNKYNLNFNDLKIKKSKAKMKMSQLIKEKERVEKLIKIAQPTECVYKKKETIKFSNVNKLLEKAKAKLNEKKIESSPNTTINTSLFKISENKSAAEEKTTKGFSLNKPKVFSKSNAFNLDDDIIEEKKLTLIDSEDEDDIEMKKFQRFNSEKLDRKPIVNKDGECTNEKVIEKLIKPLANKKKVLKRDIDELVENDKYVEWVSPDQNEKSCSMSLNEKYGY